MVNCYPEPFTALRKATVLTEHVTLPYLRNSLPSTPVATTALECVRELVHGLEAFGGIDGETAEDDRLELGGQLGAEVAQLGGRAAQPGDHGLLRRLAGERQLAA